MKEKIYYCFEDKIINYDSPCNRCVKISENEAIRIMARIESLNDFVTALLIERKSGQKL